MADADRDEALRLIAHFERKFFSGKELKPEALAHFFGGSRRHWGNILYNKGMPTRLDLQCLRAANEIVAVRRVEGDDVLTELSSTRPVDGVRASIAPSTPETVKAECLKIRTMAKEAQRGSCERLDGAKPPLQRRDGSIYDLDSWRVVYRQLVLMIDDAFKTIKADKIE